jgi:hypothetical protein
MMLEDVGRREIEGMMKSLQEAMKGYTAYHNEYISTITDDKEMDLALDKLIELEGKTLNCLAEAEEYNTRFTKSSRLSSKSSKDEERLSCKSKKSIASEKDREIDKTFEELKNRLDCEEKLYQNKLRALKREIEIRREIQFDESGRGLSGQMARRPSDSKHKVKEENPIMPTSKKQKETIAYKQRSSIKPHRDNEKQTVTRRVETTLNTPVGIPLPFVLNENKIPLNVFEGKKENWPRFIQTFKAVVDKQPYDTVVKLAILEQHHKEL